jgi:hypothetical protein
MTLDDGNYLSEREYVRTQVSTTMLASSPIVQAALIIT